MVIKMTTIDAAHAANAIQYVLDKEKARKEDKPVFLASNNIELNPMTEKPYSPVDILMDMQLLQSASRHKSDEPFWRIELCPPPEVCRDWTMQQWDDFHRDCIGVLDFTDYKREVVRDKDGMAVINKKTGKPKMKVSGKHTMLAKSQYVATVHFDTGKPHVHIVANRLTMDGQMQDTHRYEERAMRAANIIAEKYGWVKAEDRDNKRMERIHETAMRVLKGMTVWDIETYFAQMRRNGFEVEPVYDSKGICRGYSVGEKLYDLDGNYSSTVMYKASARKFGHGRDLTVSKLHDTWLRQHPEQDEALPKVSIVQKSEPQPVVSSKTVESKPHNNKEQPRVMRTEDTARAVLETPRDMPEPHKPTKGEEEREKAEWFATMSVSRFVKSPFQTEFSLFDQEDILPEGIVAKAIDMGDAAGASFDKKSLETAAQSFIDKCECSAERADAALDRMMNVITTIALPETQPSLGGGRGNNDLPKKKDEEWEWWRKNGFIKPQRSRSRRR